MFRSSSWAIVTYLNRLVVVVIGSEYAIFRNVTGRDNIKSTAAIHPPTPYPSVFGFVTSISTRRACGETLFPGMEVYFPKPILLRRYIRKSCEIMRVQTGNRREKGSRSTGSITHLHYPQIWRRHDLITSSSA